MLFLSPPRMNFRPDMICNTTWLLSETKEKKRRIQHHLWWWLFTSGLRSTLFIPLTCNEALYYRYRRKANQLTSIQIFSLRKRSPLEKKGLKLNRQKANIASGRRIPTNPFAVLEAKAREIGEYGVVQERHTTDFEAQKRGNGWSGFYLLAAAWRP